MAFHGVLEIDNKQYKMLQWNLHISQRTDQNGRPMANPEGGKITVTLESTGDNDFFEWVVSPDMSKNGRIVFQRRDNTSSLKTFEFKNAYCIDYFEDFIAEGSSPMKLRITISALELKSGSAQLAKNWDKAKITR
jgi:hypothetical protein